MLPQLTGALLSQSHQYEDHADHVRAGIRAGRRRPLLRLLGGRATTGQPATRGAQSARPLHA